MMGLAAIGGAALFINHHVQTQLTTAESAEDQFAQARARLGGQPPLVEISENDEAVLHVHRPDAGPAHHGRPLAMHLLTFDPRTGKVVTISLPFWLLRLAPSRRVSIFGDSPLASDRVCLTLDEIESHAPGLILDHDDPRGARLLVWTE